MFLVVFMRSCSCHGGGVQFSVPRIRTRYWIGSCYCSVLLESVDNDAAGTEHESVKENAPDGVRPVHTAESRDSSAVLKMDMECNNNASANGSVVM